MPVDDKRVLLFGGFQGNELGVSGDAYILDMEAMVSYVRVQQILMVALDQRSFSHACMQLRLHVV